MSARDRPFLECARQGMELNKMGHDVLQKFTCSACGARNTMEDKNVFHMKGTCGDCGHLTDIEARGCGYMLVMNLRPGVDAREELDHIFERLNVNE